jgi:methionine sulfoxide reductase heme-binding subunit
MRLRLLLITLFALGAIGMSIAAQHPQATAMSINTDQFASTSAESKTQQLKQQLSVKFKQSWPWYVARGAGLTAAVLLILLIFSGIGLITGFTYRIIEPIAAWSVHRAIAIAFGISVCIHVFVLLFDKYVGFSFVQLLLPFSSNYKPISIGGVYVGSLYVALGVYAFYIMIIVIFSSLFWKDKKPYLWQALHYLGYLLVILTFFHALFLGYDLQYGWLRKVWIAMGILLLAGIIMRLRRSGSLTIKHKQKS